MYRHLFIKSLASFHPQSCRQIQCTAVAQAINLKMPSLSPTMEAGTIVKWLKQEGDAVAAGDVICEVQTDKAVVAFEVDDDGTLAKVLLPEGSADVPVGTMIALMAEEGEDWKSVEAPAVGEAASAAPSSVPSTSASAPSSPTGDGEPEKLLGPAVKLLLNQYGLESSSISHSGPHGTLMKGDVLKHIKTTGSKPVAVEASSLVLPPPSSAPTSAAAAPPSPSSTENYTDIPLTSMRKTIAKRLLQSKQQSPHTYATSEINIGRISAMRKQLKAESTSVSVNDFIVKAVGCALHTVPEVNINITDSGEVRLMQNVDVSVAVATPSGLITPIVTAADSTTVIGISAKIKELAGKAKDNQLKPEEFMGGSCTLNTTFVKADDAYNFMLKIFQASRLLVCKPQDSSIFFRVSNLGMFGISNFTAIINPPQGAILAVGGLAAELDSASLKEINKISVTLCFDGRGISETAACTFLATFKEFMEDPDLMILGQSASRRSFEQQSL